MCSNTGTITNDPYLISRQNSIELIKLSSITKVSLVQVLLVVCFEVQYLTICYYISDKLPAVQISAMPAIQMHPKKCQAVDGLHACSHEVLPKILTPAVTTKLTEMNILLS